MTRTYNALAFGTLLALAGLSSCATPDSNEEQSSPTPEHTRSKVAVSQLPNSSLNSSGPAANPLAPAPSTRAPAPVGDDGREYAAIHKIYAAQHCAEALPRLDEFERHFPQSTLFYQAENLHGLCFLTMKQPQVAVIHFKKAVDANTVNPAYQPYLQYNLAKAQFESGMAAEAEVTLGQIHEEGMDADNRVKLHFLQASVYKQKNLNYEAAREILTAGAFMEAATPPGNTVAAAELHKAFEAQLDPSLQQITGTAQVQDLYRDFENSPLADLVLFRLIAKEISLGQTAESEAHMRLMNARFPSSAYTTQANGLLESLQAQADLDRSTVGVLLPLKGRYAKFAQKSLQAIELAFHIYGPEQSEGHKSPAITLVVEDSGDEPDQALAALNRLVLKHHVSAVIGPLLSKGIEQVSKRADELGVPMLSLAHFATLPTASPGFAVQAGITSQLQAHEIARYAIETLGLRRFAIIYPKGKGGEDSAQSFWDTVDQLGGQIVGIESYAPSDTDFRQVIDKVSGLYYTEARSRELEALAKLRKDNQIKKRTRKTEQYFSLPPLADYQAVFIPDVPKTAALIMPTFAYRDVDHVQFLGISSWNSPVLAAEAPTYAESSLFVDAFFAKSRDPHVQEFIQSFRGNFDQDPTEMEAIAFDTALTLNRALQAVSADFSRKELLAQLRETHELEGVTGKLTYRDGQLERNLKVLTLRGGQIIEDTK
jgi:branched-chain amino acid transport system substrate-binding protein